MDLPVEIWMHVFENLRIDNVCARPRYIQAYYDTINSSAANTALAKGYSIERVAYDRLPAFEKKAWKATKIYLGINRNSRAAVLRLPHLTADLLKTCAVPYQSFNDRLLRDHPRDSPVVFELFNPRALKQKCNDLNNSLWSLLRVGDSPGRTEEVAMEKLFRERFAHHTIEKPLLHGSLTRITRVALLTASPDKRVDRKAEEYTDQLEEWFEEQWKGLAKEWKELKVAGQVEVWDRVVRRPRYWNERRGLPCHERMNERRTRSGRGLSWEVVERVRDQATS